MGNSPSLSHCSSSTNGSSRGAATTATRHHDPLSGATRVDEPTNTEVDQLFRVMCNKFHNEMADMEIDNIDKGLMILKLLTKLQEEYPSLRPVVAAAAAAADPTTPFPAHKKQKISLLENTPHNGNDADLQCPTIYPRNTLQGQPFEVLARVAHFLTRSDINNYGVTCKRIHGVVRDPNFVELPWPLSCPFEVLHPSELDVPPQVFFSDDKSRAAVYREGDYSHYYDANDMRTVEVWDRNIGLLGEVEAFPCIYAKPVFSPNNELLMLGQREHDTEIKLCQLPRRGSKAHIAVSYHSLSGAMIGSFTFLDNDTICFIDKSNSEVHKSKILVDSKRCHICRMGFKNQISFSAPEVISSTNHGLTSYGLASFLGKTKRLLAYFSKEEGQSHVLIHDFQSNVTIPSRLVARNTEDLAFSPDGNFLVVAGLESLTLFDCSGANSQDTTEGKTLRFLSSDGFYYDHISWLPGPGSKICVAKIPTGRSNWLATNLSFIDIGKKELICDRWDESSWRMMVS